MTIIETLKALIKTMTGVDATGKTIEKLLRELNENYIPSEGGGSSSDTYETVVEIAVGTMTEEGGMYIYNTSASAPIIDKNSTYYLDDASYPNDNIIVGDGDTVIAFNTILGEPGRVDPNKPYIVFEWENGSLVVVSDTNDAENKTFRILKKVSDGGGSLPSMTGQSGKFLTNDGTDASWADVPSGLPDTTGASVGDVVTLGESGAEWATPQGGADDTMYLDALSLSLTSPITVPDAPEWAKAYDISAVADALSTLGNEKAELRIYSPMYEDGLIVPLVRGDGVWTNNVTIDAGGITWDNPDEDCFAIIEVGDLFATNVEFTNATIYVQKKNVLPYVDTTNNGQVLGVSGGVWKGVSPSALSNAPLYVAISQTGSTLSTDKTAAEITAALDAGKAVVLRQKAVMGAGTAEETTVWSEKTLVGVYHIAATGYELVYVEYDGDTNSWDEITMTAATGADVFTYTPSNP